MTQTWIQKGFRPFKEYFPEWIWNPVRSCGTALLTPLLFSWQTGHLKSSFRREAVSSSGDPLPWYTYPCIEFLKHRSYHDRTILEFGAGQSTLWWSKNAKRVVSFEGDEHWHQRMKAKVSSNVELHFVPDNCTAEDCVDAVNRILADSHPCEHFDVVIIDGLWRYQMIDIAVQRINATGVIICDNAEGYGFFEGFRQLEFARVDFFGNAPGVVLPHCTSIFFRPGSFIFDPKYPMPNSWV